MAWIAPALVAVMVGVLLATQFPRTGHEANASSTPSTIPVEVHGCAEEDVVAESSLEGATGSLAGGIFITNVGTVPCVLIGPPSTVELRSEHGALDVELRIYRSLRADNSEAAPPVLLEPGGKAESFVLWSNWCAGELSNLEMLVTLPDGNRPIVTVPESIQGTGPVTTPRCDNPAAKSGLGVFAFRPFAS